MRRGITIFVAAAALLAANVTAVFGAPPTNDRFGQAIRFTSIPFDHSVDTTEATRSASDPSCVGEAHTVWYRLRPSTDGDILATTAGSDYSTSLSVYTGEPGNLTQIACSGGRSGSQVRFAASAGDSYHIMAGSCCGRGGNLRLRVQEWVPFDMDVTVRRARIDPRIGDVIVRGTITCTTPADDVSINVDLRQKRPDERINHGSGFGPIDCDGGTRRWKALVAGRWAFRPGWARVMVDTFACPGDDECVEHNITKVIRLRWKR